MMKPTPRILLGQGLVESLVGNLRPVSAAMPSLPRRAGRRKRTSLSPAGEMNMSKVKPPALNSDLHLTQLQFCVCVDMALV